MKRAILLTALILVPSLAIAHDSWDWIMNGGYRAANGTKCCTDDCRKGGVSNLKKVEGGYEFDAVVDGKVYRLKVLDAAVHASIDADYWFCVLPVDLAGNTARCLFLPGSV